MRLCALAVVAATCLTGIATAQSTPSPALLVLSKHDHTMAIVDPATLQVGARLPVGAERIRAGLPANQLAVPDRGRRRRRRRTGGLGRHASRRIRAPAGDRVPGRRFLPLRRVLQAAVVDVGPLLSAARTEPPEHRSRSSPRLAAWALACLVQSGGPRPTYKVVRTVWTRLLAILLGSTLRTEVPSMFREAGRGLFVTSCDDVGWGHPRSRPATVFMR